MPKFISKACSLNEMPTYSKIIQKVKYIKKRVPIKQYWPYPNNWSWVIDIWEFVVIFSLLLHNLKFSIINFLKAYNSIKTFFLTTAMFMHRNILIFKLKSMPLLNTICYLNLVVPATHVGYSPLPGDNKLTCIQYYKSATPWMASAHLKSKKCL